MAGWGTGSFENEDAAEWLKQLPAISLGDVTRILTKAASDPEYLEARDCSIGLAAAELVAAWSGSAAGDLPASVSHWVTATNASSKHELAALALQAVRRIVSNSELKDLWLEADGLREWQASVRELEHRLAKSIT